jgi:LuxR family maltose regulon positive regulatory protein
VARDRPAALAALGQAMAQSPEPDSHVRLFLDEGPPMLALLHEAGEHDGPLRQHARRILSFVDVYAGSATPRSSLPEPLSQRELQVLRLLDTELTGPEIARELYVSVNTLRTHTRRIFTKLGVTTRAAAVRRARELGLLSSTVERVDPP